MKKKKRRWWRQWCEKEKGKEVWWEKVVLVLVAVKEAGKKGGGETQWDTWEEHTLLWRDLFVYIPVELPVRFFTLNLMHSLHNVQKWAATTGGLLESWNAKNKREEMKVKNVQKRDGEVAAALRGDVLRCKCALCVCQPETAERERKIYSFVHNHWATVQLVRHVGNTLSVLLMQLLLLPPTPPPHSILFSINFFFKNCCFLYLFN